MIRTLFVEDEPDLRQIVEAALGLDPDFVVHAFSSAEEALDWLKDHSEPLDLALLDIRLPRMSGMELHRELRRIRGLEEIRTVLMTASLLPRDIVTGPEDAILGVIEKPFHPLRLAADLRRMLARSG